VDNPQHLSGNSILDDPKHLAPTRMMVELGRVIFYALYVRSHVVRQHDQTSDKFHTPVTPVTPTTPTTPSTPTTPTCFGSSKHVWRLLGTVDYPEYFLFSVGLPWMVFACKDLTAGLFSIDQSSTWPIYLFHH
jgi:hypothetical protein